MSDDGQYGMTIIAFVGSVFSPYYALACGRNDGAADPREHCAFNVVHYRLGGKRWAMTERAAHRLHRSRDEIAIGPSSMRWTGRSLAIRVDEIAVPVPRRLRGRIDLWPAAMTGHSESLDPQGRHTWHPFAPCSRIVVRMEEPSLRWTGNAYFDSNTGTEAPARAFRGWDWSRARRADGDAVVLYEVDRRNGPVHCIALRFDERGGVERFEPPPRTSLTRSRWGLQRATRCDPGSPPGILRSLEDTPFYARSLVASRLLDEPVVAVHESLSLDRFQSPWVRLMLPFRMPRNRF
ncbi:MAG: carotenoid 1,2-hydratase [Lautropia sp.]